MKRRPMYQVFTAAGPALEPGPRFRVLADAERYVSTQPGASALGIRNPDGTWHSPPACCSNDAGALGGKPAHPSPEPSLLNRRARILVVDDHEGSRNALAELLRDALYSVDTAVDGQDALERVGTDQPDLIITDVMMPHTDGFELVKRLRQRAAMSDLPIILISGVDDATRRVDGLDLGADDYLPKPLDADELLARIRVHLRHAHRSREIIARSAIDELTGVLNRGGILGVLERERERARRDRTPLAVLMIDVDDFKSINDTYGHAVGDDVLRQIAADLVDAVRANDRVGRFGGDEFLIVAPNTGLAAAETLAQRIKRARRRKSELGDGTHLHVSLSLGSAVDSDSLDTEALFNRADAEMYRHKRQRHSVR